MEPERWRRLSDVFHRALDQPKADRQVFVDGACGDDADLRAEVQSLIAHHEQAGDFLQAPAAMDAASPPKEPAESLVGCTLNQYQVRRTLGRGGMGIVYLADDTRLGRPVALKALARRFTRDATRRERLRREARAAAALSHPGIATVYALEEHEGDLFIVSEFVPGHTLREEVATGPLPSAALLETCVAIARALAAAHRQGVVHRDLKPENVIRTGDGAIKVLDFGLARQLADGRDDAASRLTEPGSMLGTPGYMPPEQLRGEPVDARADIFSFGVLAYELATGAHPFTTDSPSSTIVRVLETDPVDLTALAPTCPHGFDTLVRHCLAKVASDRVDSAAVLVERLEQLRRDAAGTAAAPLEGSGEAGRESRRHPMWWWQFHQAVVGLGYYAMLIPIWAIRERPPSPLGLVLFLAAVVAVGVAANLRLHLWFTSSSYPNELPAQRARVAPFVRAADWLFVLLMLLAAVATGTDQAAMTALFVGVALGSALGFSAIEPVTARAAFSARPGRSPSGAGVRRSG